MNGALLIHKHAGVSSFGVIELIQKQVMAQTGVKWRDLPKMGHGGTLDPFATGLLILCAGRGVKLARYFLGSTKCYEGTIRFGETTVPGDPTSPVSERSEQVPASLEEIRELAKKLTLQPYLQTPPMHSAKKKNGKPLYELAREGIEIEREPKLCHLYEFEILSYEKPLARFRVTCSSGTYIRTLAQDFGRLLGTVAMLDSLERTASGIHRLENAWTVDQITSSMKDRKWDELPCWVPFDRLLDGYDRAYASKEEALALVQGRQNVLINILRRIQPSHLTQLKDESDESCVAIYEADQLIAIARRTQNQWGLDRVFA